jgi:hypothetical protein
VTNSALTCSAWFVACGVGQLPEVFPCFMGSLEGPFRVARTDDVVDHRPLLPRYSTILHPPNSHITELTQQFAYWSRFHSSLPDRAHSSPRRRTRRHNRSTPSVDLDQSVEEMYLRLRKKKPEFSAVEAHNVRSSHPLSLRRAVSFFGAGSIHALNRPLIFLTRELPNYRLGVPAAMPVFIFLARHGCLRGGLILTRPTARRVPAYPQMGGSDDGHAAAIR